MKTIVQILDFIDEKKNGHYQREQIRYMSPGGSFVSGTNDQTSDFDFRGIVTLDEDHYFGLRKFEHQKMISGSQGINNGEDMDVEIFELFHWLEGLVCGEIIPFEMAFIQPEFILLNNPILFPIFENLDLFLSKKIVGNYFGFVQKCLHRMKLPAESFTKETSTFRVREFGYETKEAMNVVKILRLTNELMTQGYVNLYREDRDELLKIKRGEFPKENLETLIDELLNKNRTLFRSNGIIAKQPEFEKTNSFFRDYRKFAFKEMGMFS